MRREHDELIHRIHAEAKEFSIVTVEDAQNRNMEAVIPQPSEKFHGAIGGSDGVRNHQIRTAADYRGRGRRVPLLSMNNYRVKYLLERKRMFIDSVFNHHYSTHDFHTALVFVLLCFRFSVIKNSLATTPHSHSS